MAQNSDWPRHPGAWPDFELRLRTTTFVIRHLLEMKQHDSYFLKYLTDGVPHRFDQVPYEQDEFAWAADHFLREDASTKVAVVVGDQTEIVERDQVRKIDPFAATGPLWCPIANMVRERPFGPGGDEIEHGSKHFAPGAKLYLIEVLGWTSHVQVLVVGRHRKTHKYIPMTVRVAWLTNWRVSLVYSPHVIAELRPAWDGSEVSKIRAEEFVARMRQIGIEAGKTVPR